MTWLKWKLQPCNFVPGNFVLTALIVACSKSMLIWGGLDMYILCSGWMSGKLPVAIDECNFRLNGYSVLF